MVNEQLLTQPLNGIVNRVLGLIPEDISIANSSYYIEGLLSSDIIFNASSYIEIPLKTTIQSEDYPYP